MKFAAQVEYIGTQYHGWQRQQAGVVTVQDKVEQALSKVANAPITVKCAGRTDTGVHALGQVIHFDTDVVRKPHNWRMGCNFFLPDDIRLIWVHPVEDDFHARFSALERSYQYCIDNRAVSSVLLMQNHTWIYGKLDEVAMHAAGQYLMGKHDFTSYRAIKCQAHTPIREITHLSVYREGDRVLMDITANAFLHHMVRNIMGVLLEIGWGKKPPEWAEQVLHARDRTQAGVTAEPTGLRLTKVGYPSHFNLPNEVSYST